MVFFMQTSSQAPQRPRLEGDQNIRHLSITDSEGHARILYEKQTLRSGVEEAIEGSIIRPEANQRVDVRLPRYHPASNITQPGLFLSSIHLRCSSELCRQLRSCDNSESIDAASPCALFTEQMPWRPLPWLFSYRAS